MFLITELRTEACDSFVANKMSTFLESNLHIITTLVQPQSAYLYYDCMAYLIVGNAYTVEMITLNQPINLHMYYYLNNKIYQWNLGSKIFKFPSEIKTKSWCNMNLGLDNNDRIKQHAIIDAMNYENAII